MKKTYVFLASIVAFMLLFYKQSVGLNLFIFNVILLTLVYVFMPKVRANRNVLLLSIGALLTSGAAAFYADWSSIFLNILTLVMLPVFLHQKMGTILLSETLGIWNIISSPVRIIRDQKFEKTEGSQNLLMKRILLYGVLPFVVFVLFFYLYRQINPVWGDYMWRMIGYLFSWTFVFLLLLAVLLMYSFWYFVKPSKLNQYANQRRNDIAPTTQPTFKSVPLNMEMWSGILLFSLLNLLLFSLLATDFQQLILSDKIPEGYTLSEYLHKGVYAVILSIVFAITLIVFYFKGAFNYYKQAAILRVLAWVWIVFNVVLILFTFYKNLLYVEAYDLTFKRVSVFIYLLLCWVGLYFTSVKLRFRKTFAYIVRKMYWAFYIMWVLTTPVNWTNWITAYNLEQAKERNYDSKNIDIEYLTNKYRLNEQNIGALYDFLKENPENSYATVLHKGLDVKYLEVVKSDRRRKWRGTRLYDKYIKHYLAKQDYKPYYAEIDDATYYEELAEVKDLDYNVGYTSNDEELDSTLTELVRYANVEHLRLVGGRASTVKSLKFLNPIRGLETLDMADFYVGSDFKMEGSLGLEEFAIDLRNSSKLEILSSYPKIRSFTLSGMYLETIVGWENVSSLQNFKISAQAMKSLDISKLRELQQLDLDMNSLTTLAVADSLPEMKGLHVSNKNFTDLGRLPVMKKLESLDFSCCNLTSLNGVEKMPNLKILNLAGNAILDISELKQMKDLESVNLGRNNISNIAVFRSLSKLREIFLQNNPIKDVTPLYSLPRLEKLLVDDTVIRGLDKQKLPSDIIIYDNNGQVQSEVEEVVETITESVEDN